MGAGAGSIDIGRHSGSAGGTKRPGASGEGMDGCRQTRKYVRGDRADAPPDDGSRGGWGRVLQGGFSAKLDERLHCALHPYLYRSSTALAVELNLAEPALSSLNAKTTGSRPSVGLEFHRYASRPERLRLRL